MRSGRGTGDFITTGIQGLMRRKDKSSVVARSSIEVYDSPSAWIIRTTIVKLIVEAEVIINIKSSKVVGLILEHASWVMEIISIIRLIEGFLV